MNKEELKSKIIKANAAYRSGAAMMSDIEYDSMLEQFKNLVSEDEYLEFTNSLNEGAIETGEKVKHPFIMGSLSKLKYETPVEVKEFIDKHCPCLIASAKVDGISCRLHYENGQLTSASTRGDGYEGISLTDKIKFVKCVPKVLGTGKFGDEYKNIDIRGELVILKDDFATMSGFANARNACAGIMNRKDWNVDDVSKITFVAYTILGDKFTKEAQFAYLNSWGGFCVAWNKQFRTYEFLYKSADEVAKTMFEYASQEFEYETDGLVLCNATYRNEEKYRPDECKAFKINQQKAITKLIDIEWSGPSKLGTFCPVALIEPVELGGAVISKATLHNVDFIEKLNIDFGDEVEIVRSGDVIPRIMRVVKKLNKKVNNNEFILNAKI